MHLPIAILALSCPAPQEPITPEPIWPEHKLILPNHKLAVVVEFSNPDVRGIVRHAPRIQRLEFTWHYRVIGLTDGKMGPDPTRWQSIQDETLTFTPTDVAWIAENTLAVGGVDEVGDTILQEWVLESPATPVLSYSQTGERRIPDLSVEIQSRRTIYRTASNGARYIGAVFRNWGDEDRPFVYMTDTQELFAVHRETLAVEKVVSPTDDQVLLAPDLALDYFDDVDSGLHPALGAVYWFIPQPRRGKMIFLLDSDLDGAPDQVDIVETTPGPDYSVYTDRTQYLKLR